MFPKSLGAERTLDIDRYLRARDLRNIGLSNPGKSKEVEFFTMLSNRKYPTQEQRKRVGDKMMRV